METTRVPKFFKEMGIDLDTLNLLTKVSDDIVNRVIQKAREHGATAKPRDIKQKLKQGRAWELDAQSLTHLILATEMLEDDMHAIEEYKNDLRNRAYNCKLGYDRSTDRGHFYIFNPSERLELEILKEEKVYVENDFDDYFKVGRTQCLSRRANGYTPNSILLFAIECPNSLKLFEEAMISKLKKHTDFSCRKDPINGGREYFNGDPYKAINIAVKLHEEMYQKSTKPDNNIGLQQELETVKAENEALWKRLNQINLITSQENVSLNMQNSR